MPFRPWGFCGERRRRPGLVGILWGEEHAARPGFQIARDTWVTPTARRAGQDLIGASFSVSASSCRVIMLPRTTGTRVVSCNLVTALLPPPIQEKHSPPIPLTRASTRNTPADPGIPAIASDHVSDATGGQHAPNADSARLPAVLLVSRTARRCTSSVLVEGGDRTFPARSGTAQETRRVLFAVLIGGHAGPPLGLQSGRCRAGWSSQTGRDPLPARIGERG
jgi:hypothetical protein